MGSTQGCKGRRATWRRLGSWKNLRRTAPFDPAPPAVRTSRGRSPTDAGPHTRRAPRDAPLRKEETVAEVADTHRAVFNELLGDALRPGSTIVVHHTSRFTRDVTHARVVKKELRRADVRVLAARPVARAVGVT